MPVARSWFWNKAEWLAASPPSILSPYRKTLILSSLQNAASWVFCLWTLPSHPGLHRGFLRNGRGYPETPAWEGTGDLRPGPPTAKGMRQ